MKLVITIERTSEYDAEPYKYLYTPEELAAHLYVVSINDGDSDLYDSVQDIKDAIDELLFAKGFDDDKGGE